MQDWYLKLEEIASKAKNLPYDGHYVDVVYRINGEDRVYQADWVKELVRHLSRKQESGKLSSLRTRLKRYSEASRREALEYLKRTKTVLGSVVGKRD